MDIFLNWVPALALLAITLIACFFRLRLHVWALTCITVFSGLLFIDRVSWLAWTLPATLLGLLAWVLLHKKTRRELISQPALNAYLSLKPQLSETEQVALEAGTVGWEGELFSGRPNWRVLLKQSAPVLTVDEQSFLDGPVEQVCAMTCDWDVTHHRADLSPEVWHFLKQNRFFGMIIPREYGGLGFSAYAHHRVLMKTASVSGTLSSTIAVPNSLGPAELLLHYGTEEQKAFYLPRLASGDEIPCFALTSPWAGSDATSIPDFGILCKGVWNSEEVLGIRLTFDKRYITLAPIATVIGLAFRLYDPDKLLSDHVDRGITLALIPRSTPGLEIGRRHLPLNMPFQNGPIRGNSIFVPLNTLIGGEAHIGEGWRMLVECLSVGRSISLPSSAAGGAAMCASTSGAYARIRKQFQMSIGRFEGVEEALSRIAGLTYGITALSRMTAHAVDRGEKPAVPSAIAKYHTTESGREVVKDAMDIHGGKGVILGPKNYLGRAWQGAPVAITVEGANILTRSMIIFGQGAIRCHPYVLQELQVAQNPESNKRLEQFDDLLFKHIGFAFSNAVRSFVLGIFHSKIGETPSDAYTAQFYRKLSRYSATLALVADTSMLVLGSKLKQKERLSARLGDVLSQLYIGSAILKRFEDQGRPSADHPFLAWAMHDCIYKIQLALEGVLRNFPLRWIARLLKILVFPLGLREKPPGDRLSHRVASLMLSPSESRDRLCTGIFLGDATKHGTGLLEHALPIIIQSEPLERKLSKALKNQQLSTFSYEEQLQEAIQVGLLTPTEGQLLTQARTLTAQLIAVDEFTSEELTSAAHQQAHSITT
jgi:acyl-CoA dehydrogenase